LNVCAVKNTSGSITPVSPNKGPTISNAIQAGNLVAAIANMPKGSSQCFPARSTRYEQPRGPQSS
jgi:hypothetical protein